MNLLDTANYYMNILIFATILIVAVLAALLFYFVKVRKVMATEEHINYSNFDRNSTMDYLKFDDIVADDGANGLGGAGMIVINDNIFVTGVDVIGYNFEHASAGEKQRTMVNAIAFANIIEQPIQLRQNVKSIDIGYNIEQFNEVKERIAKELIEVKENYQDMVMQAESRRDEPEVIDAILKNLGQMERQMYSLEWKLKEADRVISYEKMMQERSSNTDKSNQVLFSYKYNAAEFTEELTPEEIKIKALIALKTKIGVYSNALENCGCSCRPLDADKLADIIRRHMHPNTADAVNLKERIDIEMSTLFVTSDSLYELEKKRLGEAAFYDMLDGASNSYQSALEESHSKVDAEINRMQQRAHEYGEAYMAGGLQ